MLSILSRYIPEPSSLASQGISLGQFYTNYDSYMNVPGDPDADGGVAMPGPFDPGPPTDEIGERVVQPTQEANAIFSEHPYLTRMYTALSPKDMTIDPVFSSNADLADVPLLHTATLTQPCIGQSWLASDGGFEAQYVNGLPPGTHLPAALRVELVRDAGQPETVQDNYAVIRAALGAVDHGQATAPSPPRQYDSGDDSSGCGCTVGRHRVHANLAMLLAACAMLLAARTLRRRRQG
jgi:hypothetical protein